MEEARCGAVFPGKFVLVLKIEGNVSRLRARPAHFVGYLLVGHRGPRILIHSDLGRLEWKASLPMCERLASRVGLDLIVVRRQAGDLMGRWLTRWENNVERYRNLECVRLILLLNRWFCRFIIL